MNDIKDALSKVADSSAPAPLSLDHVRGRARQIRRRRAMTAVVGSAAAIAAIAGLGVATMPSGSHDDSRPPIAKTPTVPVSPDADVQAVGTVHHVRLDGGADQTSGAEPGVPYWSRGQIIDTDGTATPFPDRPFTFAKDPATGDWVVIRPGEAHAELLRIAADGRTLSGPVPTFEHGLAVGPRGELSVLTAHNTDVTLHQGARTLDLGSGFESSAIYGVMPNGDVLFQGAAGGVDVAQLDVGGTGPVTDAGAAATSLQTGFAAYAGNNGSWRMEDENGTRRWTLDWAGVSSFSPNGRFVALVGDPKHRINGSADWDSDHATGTIWVRTSADLLPVAAFVAPDGGYFWSWAWDGNDLLATVFLKGQWSLVRLSPDGFTVARASAQPGRGEQPAYVFATQ